VNLEPELLCEVGSRAHGLTLESTDDRDLLGISIEPREYVIGLKRWETSVVRTHADGSPIPEGERSGPGDTDLTVHSLRKFVSLALNGNPTIISLFWAKPVERPSGIGTVLRALGPRYLLSRRALNAYLGYLKQQRERLLGQRGQKRSNRPELVEAHGYDTKYAAHALRLGWQGEELATTGKLSLPMKPDEREVLLEVRRGGLSLTEVVEAIEEAEDHLLRLRDSKSTSLVVLPEQPNYDWANWFLVESYQRAWSRDDRERVVKF
jgi:hypothetical protein